MLIHAHFDHLASNLAGSTTAVTVFLLRRTIRSLDPSSCDYACYGNATKSRGGFWYISVYQRTLALPVPPADPTGGSVNVTDNVGNHGARLSTSDKLALGAGIGVPVPALIVASVSLARKIRDRRYHRCSRDRGLASS